MSQPAISPLLMWGFRGYVSRYLRRHFNALRIVQACMPKFEPDEPVICCANHPGWWDPLVACFLNHRYFGGRHAYSPIDSVALAKYPLFQKLGYFGIQMETIVGAKRFLKTSRAILADTRNALWITPGGKFCDVRATTHFEPGLGHLVASMPRVTVVPLAIEYAFWEERTPEALFHFGPALRCQGHERSKETWHDLLQERLAEAQGRLAEISIARDTSRLETIADGVAGVGGPYDAFRRARAWICGDRFERRHGTGWSAADV